MPYKVRGSNVLHDPDGDGHYTIKQHCSSPENALKALRLLNMKEHGVTPKGGWKNRRGLKR